MNIELRLLATMLHRGDFSPLIRGDITTDHFVSDEGKILYSFVANYKRNTGGAARFPSLAVVRKRFAKSAIELPDPDPGDSVSALAYETVLQKLRSEIKVASTDLDTLANSSSDPLGDCQTVLAKLRRITEKTKKAQHTSLMSGIQALGDSYLMGNIIPEGIPWPWPSLQQVTHGAQKKEFVVIAGRPKSRKTFTALHTGVHAMKAAGARVLVFSPEMPAKQILLRAVADFCKLRYTELKDGTLDEAEEMRLWEAVRTFVKLDDEDDDAYGFRLLQSLEITRDDGRYPCFEVLQSTGRDVPWLEEQIHIYQPDIVLFDSFYRQRAEGVKKHDVDQKAVVALSRSLKDLAMETDICAIGTHQINRSGEEKVGSLANLSLSDAIGQDADLVLRVITGKVEGNQVSALVVLGGREVPFDGIMINNVPSVNFDEIATITSLSQVEKLMRQEEAENAAEAEEQQRRTMQQQKKGAAPKRSLPKSELARRIKSDLDDEVE